MQLLLIILSVMTFTVKDRNTVTTEDAGPANMEVSYSCSYQKGQVRAGDEAVLTLTQLGGITIEKVEMAMRGNKSGGAATVTVAADDYLLTTNDVYYWNVGSSDVVYGGSCDNVNELEVSLIGTQNSMYVDSYTITYAAAPIRNVTLMKGDKVYAELAEEAGGVGVLLPVLPDSAEWIFAGWSEQEFYAIEKVPSLYKTGIFYPMRDITLWAVYVNAQEYVPEFMTTVQSGDYLYVNCQTGYALTGVPENKVMGFDIADETDENQLYTIDFLAPDTAYITHTKTQTPIGFSGTSMAAKKSKWLVFHQEEETIFYTTIKGQDYVLWLNIADGYGNNVHAGLMNATITPSPMALLKPSDAEPPVYTCHPEGKVALRHVSAQPETDYTLPLGNYEMHIHNGHKYIQLR